jgi:hypothetical protein
MRFLLLVSSEPAFDKLNKTCLGYSITSIGEAEYKALLS